MPISYQKLAVSGHPAAVALRRLRRSVLSFTLPAPRLLVRPALAVYVTVRAVEHFLLRVFWAEPLFKAYCTRCGKGVRTGIFVHWIEGRGKLNVGDGVLVDGKCNFSFAARYVERPTLSIGDHTGIGHNCTFVVGKAITIGRHCRIASDCILFDASGHPSDPAARRAGEVTPAEEVRPITIGDNVWLGRRAIVYPGVTIGEGSVVSSGAVVTADVPPNTVVAGNPARRIASLDAADVQEQRPQLRSS